MRLECFSLLMVLGCSATSTPTHHMVQMHRHHGVVESSRWKQNESRARSPSYRSDLEGLALAPTLDRAVEQRLIEHYESRLEDWSVDVPVKERSSRVFSLGPEDENGDTRIYLTPAR